MRILSVFRYVVLTWNAKSPSDSDAARGVRQRMQASKNRWQSALDRPGVYAAFLHYEFSSDAAIGLTDNRGVIFGAIYQPPTAPCPAAARPMGLLSERDSAAILQSAGRWLMFNTWGHYVAVLHFPAKESTVVLRSPAGRLPCFQLRHGGVNLFFSNLDDCASIEVAPLSINWDTIAAQVVGFDYLTNETAIEGITGLECGECVECTPHGCSKHVYWDPRTFLDDRSTSDFSEATQAVRRTTDHCVSAISYAHSDILVQLSGGLDSSIVLSSLSRAAHQPSITAVNYYSRGCGDERRFARRMARHANCTIMEQPRNEELDLHRFLDCNRTVRPVLNFSAPDVEARNIAIAREVGASAIFDGEMGDNVFGSQPGPGVLAECIQRYGLGKVFLSSAVDYAMMSKQSVWRTISLARRELRSVADNPDFRISAEMQRHYGKEGARSALLASAAAEEHYGKIADRFLHPWLKQSRRIAPGSHMLLYGLITVTSALYHSPFAKPGDPLRLSPLVSQPLVELALRIPNHLHCYAAQDRAVARAAFADVLPTEVLHRGLGKGGPTLWAKDVVEKNAEFLREFFLDGVLVKHDLVDRKKIEGALSPRIVKSTVIVGDIFAKLYIEAWLRSFSKLSH
jgi:asparagine synthase (glutamine-hydrolysing)